MKENEPPYFGFNSVGPAITQVHLSCCFSSQGFPGEKLFVSVYASAEELTEAGKGKK
jgi:hypothetical protein